MRVFIILIFLCSIIYSQPKIDNYLSDIYAIDITASGGMAQVVNTLEDSHPMAKLVNENSLIYNYLFVNGIEIPIDSATSFSHNSNSLGNYLLKDTSFVRLSSSIAPNANKEKTYSKFDVIKIAVRFFYPDFIMNGKIQGHICIGLNGMSDYEKRDKVLEGFIFQSILWNLDYKESKLSKEWKAAEKKAEDLDLSTNENIKLNRAQGIVWLIMQESEVLWEIIVKEYKHRKNILPFSIEGV